MIAALRDWMRLPFTWAAAVLVAVAAAVSLWISPPREVAAPPVTVTRGAEVNGACSVIVTSSDGSVWAAPYEGGGQLVRIDPATVGSTGCKKRSG